MEWENGDVEVGWEGEVVISLHSVEIRRIGVRR
jgi:hypothetical protein